MMRALWTAATGMEAQQMKIDVIANNLANVNTTGFKKGRADFEDLLYQTLRDPGASAAEGQAASSGTQVGLGSRTVAISKLFAQGELQQTTNELDVSIEGKGFFQVLRNGDELAYTRAGAFKVNADGLLTTATGETLEPQIEIPSEALNVAIAPDGTVSVTMPGETEAEEVGTIELARFANPDGLRNLGHNLLAPTGASGEPITGVPGEEGFGSVSQGFLEMSNVNLVEEMVQMIVGQRAYEISSKVITTADQMLQSVSRVV
ncbi:MAG: flagellar basal-body rod protein FlgG [Deltaproteobacteria bacterium]|nr:flagellar basal-body rod protein FlgG [Deltaproteobacteria bacterium]MCB9489008.1 flagellar basal-body rod protein FlgG [Deltaproteobacteria bacterium]